MRDVLPSLRRWLAEGHRCGLAVVTHTWGASPRPIGSALAANERGDVVGSVSGGCVEAAVVEALQESFVSEHGRLLEFKGLSDDAFWDVGLSCGGTIHVWVQPWPKAEGLPGWSELAAADIQPPYKVGIKLKPDDPRLVVLVEDGLDTVPWLSTLQHSGETLVDGERWFACVEPRQDELVIVGAVHIAVPLVAMARSLGMRSIVIDPRGTFARMDRFASDRGAEPDELIVEWPETALTQGRLHESAYVVVLSHDPKIDDPALKAALRSKAAYIGALGSRKTQEQRRNRLLAEGFTAGEVERIRGPVGMAIGAKTPAEIAVSILAEIVQVKRSVPV